MSQFKLKERVFYSSKYFPTIVNMKEERSIETVINISAKIVSLSTLELAIHCNSFYIKFINASYKIIKELTTNDALVYEKYQEWILILEINLQIRKSWFKPVFQGLYQQARKNGNEELLGLLQRDNFSQQIQLKKSKIMNNTMVEFYKGQYYKAIEKWEEMALLGKQPLENLLKTVNLLHELKCYYEIATFVVWTYTNFSEDVSDF